MIPAGYMAKNIETKTDWLKAEIVQDIYSVSGCISDYFTDYIQYFRHNGFYFINSPQDIINLSNEISVCLKGAKLFYYEVYELEFQEDKENWRSNSPEQSLHTEVVIPEVKTAEGFDIVTFSCGTSPECSPLSCNSVAAKIKTNTHCLLDTFEEAKESLENGKFKNSEPGPSRIFSVYSVEWL